MVSLKATPATNLKPVHTQELNLSFLMHFPLSLVFKVKYKQDSQIKELVMTTPPVTFTFWPLCKP
jgi:hypothetical protein